MWLISGSTLQETITWWEVLSGSGDLLIKWFFGILDLWSEYHHTSKYAAMPLLIHSPLDGLCFSKSSPRRPSS